MVSLEPEVYKITNLNLKMKTDSVFCVNLTLDYNINIREFDVDLSQSYKNNTHNFVKIFFKKLIEAGKLYPNKYIYARLGVGTRYRWIEEILHFDIVKCFDIELEKFKNKDFVSELPVYNLLLKIGRDKNEDDEIPLLGKWSGRIINKQNLCYRKEADNQTLSVSNMEAIYDKFYKNKKLPDSNDSERRPIRYGMLLSKGIYLTWHVDRVHSNYHKSRSRKDYCGPESEFILSLGSELNEDEREFLKKVT